MANLGAYGDTEQASLSPLEYIYVVAPIGTDQWSQARVYEIRWRDQDLWSTVSIELYHGGGGGVWGSGNRRARPPCPTPARSAGRCRFSWPRRAITSWSSRGPAFPVPARWWVKADGISQSISMPPRPSYSTPLQGSLIGINRPTW